ncbi:hypothetical protein B0H10DRAFT_1944578 [Mycena sp. CBHHK59/15]|nr:hypothetical protein B0H10DRAFT_1944578 [Mycena sp. CBHHK59/15]
MVAMTQYSHGGYGTTQPPFCGTERGGNYVGERTSPDNLSKDGPGKKNVFHWMELLCILGVQTYSSDESFGTATVASSSSSQAAPPTVPSKKTSKAKAALSPPPPSWELRPRTAPSTGSKSRTKRSGEDPASNLKLSKRQKAEEKEDPRKQCASYALELLTYGSRSDRGADPRTTIARR